jgi:hypothetical protein
MFGLNKLWNENGFEIVLGVCLSIILICGFYRVLTKQKGNWSNSYSTYKAKDIDKLFSKNNNIKNSLPKESKGEIECKRILEQLFNKPFHKIRPNFLFNDIVASFFLNLLN